MQSAISTLVASGGKYISPVAWASADDDKLPRLHAQSHSIQRGKTRGCPGYCDLPCLDPLRFFKLVYNGCQQRIQIGLEVMGLVDGLAHVVYVKKRSLIVSLAFAHVCDFRCG